MSNHQPNNPAPAPILLSTAFRSYVLSLQAANVVPKHVRQVERVRQQFTRRFGDLEIGSVTPDVIRRWLVWLAGQDEEPGAPPAPPGQRGGPLSSSGVDGHFRTLKAFFNFCEREELIHRSPFHKVRRPKVEEKLPDALTELEVAHLLESVRTNGDRNAYRDYCLHLFFLDTGVRLSELAALTPDDLRLDEGYCKVMGKGRKERLAPMGLELRRAMSLYLLKHRRAAPGETALFTNEYGFRLNKETIQHIVTKDLKRYVARPLSRIGPHTHRHTYGTFDLREGGDLKATSLRLGHTTTRVTERYTHLTGTDVLRGRGGSPIDQLLRTGRIGRNGDGQA